MSTALIVFAPTALSATITVLKFAFDTVVLVKDVTGFIVNRIWYGDKVLCENCRQREEQKEEFAVVENKQKIIRTRIILDDVLPAPDNTPVHL